jgi:hypothetical protein
MEPKVSLLRSQELATLPLYPIRIHMNAVHNQRRKKKIKVGLSNHQSVCLSVCMYMCVCVYIYVSHE